MTFKIPLWVMIPAMILFTLTFFISFENYSINEWILGNSIVATGISIVYIGEFASKKLIKIKTN